MGRSGGSRVGGKQGRVEFEEGIAPGVEAQEGIVAPAESAKGGEEGFDGGKARRGVCVDFRLPGIGGSPLGRYGGGFDWFDRLAHGSCVAAAGVEEKEGARGVGGRQRGRIGGEKKMSRKIGEVSRGIGGENQAGRIAEGPDGAFARVFAAANDDEDRRIHGTGEGILARLGRPTNEQNGPGETAMGNRCGGVSDVVE